MRKLFRLLKYLEYQWRAKTKYYLHSPFVYQFYLNVIEGKNDESVIHINTLRQKLQTGSAIISVTDFGTGNSIRRKISSLEKDVAVTKKYGELLHRIVKHFQPEVVLELGTSLGVSSAYMALANPKARIISIDGSFEICQYAGENHTMLGVKNIEVLNGNFDALLPDVLKEMKVGSFIFFDGNHTREATLRYFELCLEKANEQSIFVFDDIYWSREMSEAWRIIQQHPTVTLSIDVYQFGICFFRKEKLVKENFVLRY